MLRELKLTILIVSSAVCVMGGVYINVLPKINLPSDN